MSLQVPRTGHRRLPIAIIECGRCDPPPSKLHKVFGDEHLAREAPFHHLHETGIIVIWVNCGGQMAEDYRLDLSARGHVPHLLWTNMLLDQVPNLLFLL